MSGDRVRCPHCREAVPIAVSAGIHYVAVHGPRGNRCPGSRVISYALRPAEDTHPSTDGGQG